ncbi:MAG: hypothetical protein VYC40_01910 [Pseudomonadota bacterium]|nr:hypothetical protein [Pseudomonadota bacterium]
MRYVITFILFIIFILNITGVVIAKQPKSKFYDFNDQIIDGEIKKPTTLYTDSRQKVKFDRLLKLKKSFLPELFDTAKERVFK